MKNSLESRESLVLRRPAFDQLLWDNKDLRRYQGSYGSRKRLLANNRKLHLPVDLAPEMISPQRVNQWRKLSIDLGPQIKLEFCTMHFPMQTATGRDYDLYPIHSLSNFIIEDIPCAGCWVPSFGRQAMVKGVLDRFVEESIFGLMDHSEVVVLGFPPLRDGSTTHQLLTNEFLGGIPFHLYNKKDAIFYTFFANGSVMRVLDIPGFYSVINKIHSLQSELFVGFRKSISTRRLKKRIRKINSHVKHLTG
jgi:hypothetical protein